ILEDPSFTFNDRSAGDLKDRFRTCCPEELRNKDPEKDTSSNPEGTTKAPEHKAKSGLLSENILLSTDKEASEQPSSVTPTVEDFIKPKKSRAHRKKVKDLAEMGIRGPFRQSHRRKGKP